MNFFKMVEYIVLLQLHLCVCIKRLYDHLLDLVNIPGEQNTCCQASQVWVVWEEGNSEVL